MQQFAPSLPPDVEAVAGQRLPSDDAANVEGEIGRPRQAAGLLVEMGDLEDPAMDLTAGVLAGDAVEPAFDPAGQPEIIGVDGQDQRAVDDAAIEPVGQHELHAFDATVMGSHLLPFVDPGELVPPPALAVADGRGDDCRLQAGEGHP